MSGQSAGEGSDAARRIGAILVEGARFSLPGDKVSSTLERILRLETAAPSIRLRRLTKFFSLPVVLRRQLDLAGCVISQSERDDLTSLELVFSRFDLNSEWQAWYGSLNQSLSVSLASLAHNLSLLEGQPSIVGIDTLVRVRAKVAEALLEISMETKLPADVRDYFHRTLTSILEAIDDYKVSGGPALSEIVQRAASDLPGTVQTLVARPGPARKALVAFLTAAALVHVGVQDGKEIKELLPWSQDQSKDDLHREVRIILSPDGRQIPRPVADISEDGDAPTEP